MIDRFSRTSCNVAWQTWHEPFGAAVALDEDPDGDDDNVVLNLRFSRQYYDAETGLHYNWHRFYDPQAGRYLQPDVIKYNENTISAPIFLTALAHYGYAYNSPYILLDPTGLGSIGASIDCILHIGLIYAADGWHWEFGIDFSSPGITPLLMNPVPSQLPEPGWNPVTVNFTIPLLFPYLGLAIQHPLGTDIWAAGLSYPVGDLGLLKPWISK